MDEGLNYAIEDSAARGRRVLEEGGLGGSRASWVQLDDDGTTESHNKPRRTATSRE